MVSDSSDLMLFKMFVVKRTGVEQEIKRKTMDNARGGRDNYEMDFKTMIMTT